MPDRFQSLVQDRFYEIPVIFFEVSGKPALAEQSVQGRYQPKNIIFCHFPPGFDLIFRF